MATPEWIRETEAAPVRPPPTQRSAVTGHTAMDIVGAGGNQAVARLLSPAGFPHSDRITAALGHSGPLRGVVDPAGCSARGTPAFTDAGVTHFASAAPDLHVAAHEAAHQLQHKGLTRDAGLGAEGHAGAVADAVVSGGPAADLIGDAGAPVAAGRHNYTMANPEGKWKGTDPAVAPTNKLADTGETLTRGSHDAYATAVLITQSNEILQKRQSGIALSPGAEQITVDAPDGSGHKTLSTMQVQIAASPDAKTMPADCRQAAREVMGLKDPNDPEAVAVRPGDQKAVVTPPVDARDTVAEIIFIQQRIRDTPTYATMTGEGKRQVVQKAKEDFAKLSPEEKQKLKQSPIAWATAEELGIDIGAEPGVGEAFSIHRATPAGPGQFDFHYAAVIMVAGQDRVTLENLNGTKHERNAEWSMETYGPASKQQTFHEEWLKKFPGGHTVTNREGQLRMPANASSFSGMTTPELITLNRSSMDSEEAAALEQVLKKRHILVDVTVDATEDYFLGDEVFVRIRSGGRSDETKYIRMKAGASSVFGPISLANLWPLVDPLNVEVIEWDLLGDDLIGTLVWPIPLVDKSEVPLASGRAKYRAGARAPK
jgi:hypothetical protein